MCGLLIVILQILMVQVFPEHQGTDDQSVELIQEIAPNYKPWVSNVWEPKNDFSEKLIFSIQAALDLAIIIFYLLKQTKKTKTV